MDQWTPRVTARRLLAEALEKQPERVRKAGLLEKDLEVLIAEGRKAEEADAEQKEQLAQAYAALSNRSQAAKDLAAREGGLRDVITAVIDDLQEEHPRQAQWLSRLSFARFRIRDLAHKGDSGAETDTDAEAEEDIKKVQRVEKEDQITRARNLGRYCRALLRPTRKVIMDQLAKRGLGPDDLELIATDAEAFVESGRNVMVAAEATAREAIAAAAQKRKWKAIRRLARNAVQGDSGLEKKLAEC